MIGIATAVRVRTILLCLATLIVKLMEVTDFTLTRIIASNTLNAQTDKPFAVHAEKVNFKIACLYVKLAHSNMF